jgi:hypothetical protein
MLRLAVAIPLVGVLLLYPVYGVSLALRTGVANAGGTLISRRRRPWNFWLVVAVQTGFVSLAAVMLLRLLREALAKAA